ncbi:MAG TPA: hypothetical protein VK518_10725 [Puia sp.]|nr:hypothetical protein [Puia sp.]
MRPHIFIQLFTILVLQSFLWSCTKKDDKCDASIKPLVTTNSPVIAGDSLKLSVSGIGNVFMYNWYGPNGFSSHDSTPVLPGVSSTNSGRYYVDVITKGGCIYSATTDSVLIGAPVLPCSMAKNEGDLSGVTNLDFTYITGSPNGGSWFLEANGPEGDAEIEFFGNTLPATGVYTAQSLGGNWGPGNVHVNFTAASSIWYGSNGTVYVSVTNKKVSVTSCNVHFSSPTWNIKTTGSFQITQP